jgi:hypothetical protein
MYVSADLIGMSPRPCCSEALRKSKQDADADVLALTCMHTVPAAVLVGQLLQRALRPASACLFIPRGAYDWLLCCRRAARPERQQRECAG